MKCIITATFSVIVCLSVKAQTIVDYSYQGDIDFSANSAYQDTSFTKLSDTIVGSGVWNNGTWVLVQESVTPSTDDGMPQPTIIFELDAEYSLTSVLVDYLYDDEGAVFAPDSVDVTFSSDGTNFSNKITYTSFDNSDDGNTASLNGDVRASSISLGESDASYVKMDFYVSQQWVALGEVTFTGTVIPEPSTYALILGSVVLLVCLRKRKR